MPFGIPKEDFGRGFGLPDRHEYKIGYRWYIIVGGKPYEPSEETFDSISACKDAVYPEYRNGFYGIDKVRDDDDGFISVIEKIVVPEKHWYE